MKQKERAIKTPADNGRFGVMAAVPPQERQCKFGSLYPAGTAVGAATTPSRWDVARKSADRVRTLNENKIKIKK